MVSSIYTSYYVPPVQYANNNVGFESAYEAIVASANQKPADAAEGYNSSPSTSGITEETPLLNLTPQTLEALNGVATPAANTQLDLQQIAEVLAPYTAEPLTQNTFAQMENALATAGFAPSELSLLDLLFAMNDNPQPTRRTTRTTTQTGEFAA